MENRKTQIPNCYKPSSDKKSFGILEASRFQETIKKVEFGKKL